MWLWLMKIHINWGSIHYIILCLFNLFEIFSKILTFENKYLWCKIWESTKYPHVIFTGFIWNWITFSKSVQDKLFLSLCFVPAFAFRGHHHNICEMTSHLCALSALQIFKRTKLERKILSTIWQFQNLKVDKNLTIQSVTKGVQN